ncbi:potassium channel family protein [Geoalkalibacter halelectricus]|uniref:Trk system potassium uptake protein TrkA n=1 Tax=Geoalkalibacter halelectricus TaxID=2847045 RepID=A0ABY5ZH25_9BACT|nr:TrkA family potassium uptake protein [Geoalkalibacter halelectricus]MDO3380244.1 TrkA family potassium uptake protein [Geoalkalibacter halelectricus]UWZ78189.1 TrkA family potassium uptake protein [Geoalkalibacter halelectricus]
MRIVFVGAGELTAYTANLLIKRGHEVIIIEAQKSKIEELSETLDCSFLHGDGSRPHILEEADPKHCDILFCLTDNDQNNIIAGLVGRSLGFKRVVINIHDHDFESICLELGLEDTIIPSRTIGRFLADMASGVDPLELSTVIEGEARLYAVSIDEDYAGKALDELELPKKTRAIFYYRDDKFHLTDKDSKLEQGDKLVFICHMESLKALKKKFNQVANDEKSPEA